MGGRMSIHDDIQNCTSYADAVRMMPRVKRYLADDHDDNDAVRQEAEMLVALLMLPEEESPGA
jgi:hypothetical protein